MTCSPLPTTVRFVIRRRSRAPLGGGLLWYSTAGSPRRLVGVYLRLGHRCYGTLLLPRPAWINNATPRKERSA